MGKQFQNDSVTSAAEQFYVFKYLMLHPKHCMWHIAYGWNKKMVSLDWRL